MAFERAKERGVKAEAISLQSDDLGFQAVLNGQVEIGVGSAYAAIQTLGAASPVRNFYQLKKLITPLLNNDIKIAFFIDPNKEQLMATQQLGVKIVEFHTGQYAESFLKNRNVDRELEKIKTNVHLANKYNISCHAGHGLNFENVSLIASIPNIEELNIGHFLFELFKITINQLTRSSAFIYPR